MAVDKDKFVRNVELLCRLRNVPPTVACRESGAGKDFLTNVKKGQSPALGKAQMLAQYLGCTVSDLLGETPGTLLDVPEGPTEQFLKLFSSLDDKAQNEIVAEMLKRKK